MKNISNWKLHFSIIFINTFTDNCRGIQGKIWQTKFPQSKYFFCRPDNLCHNIPQSAHDDASGSFAGKLHISVHHACC